MKSYTDLEQSKKLAEILPLESADMHYDKHSLENYYCPIPLIGKYSAIHDQIHCWSLAALLNVLPLEIDTHKQTDGHKIYYYVECMKNKIYLSTLSTERYENLIDACYEMIVKLHKVTML